MLVAVALVPETALLVPGAGGAAPLLAQVRAAAVGVVAELVAAGPDRVVVVAPTTGRTRTLTGLPLRPTLGAAGVPDDMLAWAPTATAGSGPVATVPDVGAAVGLLLLAQAGWRGEVRLVLASAGDQDLAGLGARCAGGRDPVAFLLTGSLSARRGPDGPLPEDARAAGVDRRVVRDLAALGGPDRQDAALRLADVPAELAAGLAISAWAPWQVLLGAGPIPPPGSVRAVAAPFGATYAVIGWGLGSR